jgi:hypothetical protein
MDDLKRQLDARRQRATGEAAKALGVNPTTLRRWWRRGLVEPAVITPGGRARWDLEDLKQQLGAFQDLEVHRGGGFPAAFESPSVTCGIVYERVR